MSDHARRPSHVHPARATRAPRRRAPRRAVAAACAALVASALAAPALLAAQEEPMGRGGVEIQAIGGLFSPGTPDFASGETAFQVDPAALVGGRLGWSAPVGLFVQAELGYSPVTLVAGDRSQDLNTLLYGGTVGFNFQASPRVQLFTLAGLGALRWDYGSTELPAEVDMAWQGGGGLRVFLSRSVALRADVRDRIAPDGMSAIRRQLDPTLPAEESRTVTHNWEFALGLSLFLETGPGTRDADGDGVPDDRDACPGTPAGETVDERGCALDGDGDGVPDDRDACPGTPAGAEVDDRGCPTDEDGDGVPDGLDRCPGTAEGTPVDERGCAVEPPEPEVEPEPEPEPEEEAEGIERELLEEGRIVMRNVYFDVGSASLRPESRPALDEVAEVLLRHPSLRIEVQGHTDAVGPADVNRRLSMARAESVLRYMLERHPELERARFSVAGLGEERPIATNQTDEGRQLNRRVEFVVVGEP